jgi:hypothetical protein
MLTEIYGWFTEGFDTKDLQESQGIVGRVELRQGVQAHPYYTTTDASGAFVLSDVPPGDYELKFWHETLGEGSRKVTVKPKGETHVSVELGK